MLLKGDPINHCRKRRRSLQKKRDNSHYLSILGSPGNPEYSGELTTHGLIPSPRDCSNQLFIKNIIYKSWK